MIESVELLLRINAPLPDRSLHVLDVVCVSHPESWCMLIESRVHAVFPSSSKEDR